MEINPEEQARAEAEYAAAFNDIDPAMANQSDADGGQEGLGSAAPVDIAAAVDSSAVSDTAAGGEKAGQTEVESQGDNAGAADESPREDGGQAADSSTPDPEPEEDIEKERQRLRSWEGRLRAQAAELERKRAAATENEPGEQETPSSESLEAVGEQAAADGNAELGEAAAAAAEAVESGDLTPEQAMKQLAEDFGEDFVRMIEVIASAKARDAGASAADEKVGSVVKNVEELAGDVRGSKEREHFRAIAEKHPDYKDVGKSEDFKQFIAGLSAEQKADAERVVKAGTASEVVDLLNKFKGKQTEDKRRSDEEKAAADERARSEREAQLSAAEGVRSSGISLPAQPKPAADSYEAAWDQF